MEEDTARNFKFINFGSELEIFVDENNQAQCPKCKKKSKQLLQHIKKSTSCKSNLDFENFKIKYQSFNNRRRQTLYRQNQLSRDAEGTHDIEAKVKRKQRERKLS